MEGKIVFPSEVVVASKTGPDAACDMAAEHSVMVMDGHGIKGQGQEGVMRKGQQQAMEEGGEDHDVWAPRRVEHLGVKWSGKLNNLPQSSLLEK